MIMITIMLDDDPVVFLYVLHKRNVVVDVIMTPLVSVAVVDGYYTVFHWNDCI